MVEKDYNFNDPVETTSIFRESDSKGEVTEYASKMCFLWEDVVGIEEYSHEDNWNKFPGPKYFLLLRTVGTKLLLGSYQSMKQYFTMFRRACPTFIKPEETPVWNGQ